MTKEQIEALEAAFTVHRSDPYLDSSKVIWELETALENHQLDEQGVLEALANAAKHCDTFGAQHYKQADEYMLARAAYFAELRRRVGVPSGSNKKGQGFKPFMKSHPELGSFAQAGSLANIGNSPSPKATLDKLRQENKKAQIKTGRIGTRVDRIHALWLTLSISERHAFLTWANANLRRAA